MAAVVTGHHHQQLGRAVSQPDAPSTESGVVWPEKKIFITVFWIRIRMNPELFPDPAKKERTET